MLKKIRYYSALPLATEVASLIKKVTLALPSHIRGISFLDRITPRSAGQAWLNRNLFISHKQDLIVIIL
ncbi:MAG: hypothetical protein ABIJ44_05505 [Pseudomonadota bacterium]